MALELGLKDKVAIVAGGSKGFGAATARRLAEEGAKLVLAARSAAQLEETAETLRGIGSAEVATVAADLTKPGDAKRVAAEAKDRFGRIDILVSSVGAAQGGIFWEIEDAAWEQAFATKFMTNVRMMRAVVPYMRDQKSGRMVIIVGQLGRQPMARVLPGSSVNAALLSVIKGVADEVAPDGVIVNAVNPGPSRTDRWMTLVNKLAEDTGRPVEEIEADYTANIPLGRFGEPDEIARHVVYLASEASGYITGSSITCDGGWLKAPA